MHSGALNPGARTAPQKVQQLLTLLCPSLGGWQSHKEQAEEQHLSVVPGGSFPSAACAHVLTASIWAQDQLRQWG